MTLPLFLAAEAELVAGTTVDLAGDEGRHAAVVRRLRAGERLELGDGRGTVATCEVSAVERRALRCTVLSVRRETAPAPRLVVVQALAKGERGELAVELLTEVGVDVVVPWAAGRCVVRWDGDRGAHGLARWRTTAREATKQSRRAWLPEVTDLASTAEVADLLRGAALGLVLHAAAAEPLATVAVPGTGDVVLVVGPEGGLTAEELVALSAVGGRPVRLGPAVLRTSTAGAVAAAVVSARTARWA